MREDAEVREHAEARVDAEPGVDAEPRVVLDLGVFAVVETCTSTDGDLVRDIDDAEGEVAATDGGLLLELR